MKYRVAAEYCVQHVWKKCNVPYRVKQGALRTWYAFTDTVDRKQFPLIAKYLAGGQWNKVKEHLNVILARGSLYKRVLRNEVMEAQTGEQIGNSNENKAKKRRNRIYNRF
eukprot:NODE_440_length_7390_cov_0.787546.p11 type:complete len:110 gc:universal NODE_440_length_7390_cov_0.787546:4267-4596(+)